MAASEFPARGRSWADLKAEMEGMRAGDADWRHGRTFSLVFWPGEEVARVVREAYQLYFSENGLNPSAFPSLRRMEQECVAMTADLLGADARAAGSMTSGGTESILMAMKTARDWARAERGIEVPEVVLPVSAHPAFDKAAHYLGMALRTVPLGDDHRADTDAMAEAIGARTAMLVGSAPQYAHGVIDPIEEIAALAEEHDVLCHVDACIGGFMLPFIEEAGYAVSPFDFRVRGVTSMSCDLHKYGYAAKGASVIVYREGRLRRHQFYVHTDWPAGIYASPTMAGTRPGGAIAAAWAVLHHLGRDGYREIARRVMETTRRLQAVIAELPGIHVVGEPDMSIFALGGDAVDPYELGDELEARGWHLDRQQAPPSLHLTVSPAHAAVVDEFTRDLEASLEALSRPSVRRSAASAGVRAAGRLARLMPEDMLRRATRTAAARGSGDRALPRRSAVMYGMMARLSARGALRDVVLDALDRMNSLPGEDDDAGGG
ncbi:MAG TPA: aspartate aminotransferase family protein [Gammaproteobacteria bacterium]|nr:aspartate aminotransferase family protein [Gammaproteobacteria bacterium]